MSPKDSNTNPGAAFRGGGGGWDSHGRYMHDKTIKLRDQLQESFTVKSSLFEGLTFWQTGRSFEIDVKRLVTEHGGSYEQYGMRRVTHVVAETIATSNQQWKALLNGGLNSRQFKIVRPQWIVDCITQATKLSEGPYLPDGLQRKNIFELSKSKPNHLNTHITHNIHNTRNMRQIAWSPTPTFVLSITCKLPKVISDDLTLEICQEISCKHITITYVQISLHYADCSLMKRSLAPGISVLEGLHVLLTSAETKGATKISLSCFTSPFAPEISVFPSVSPVQRLEGLMTGLPDSPDFDKALEAIGNEGGDLAVRAAALDAVARLCEMRKFDKVRKLLLACLRAGRGGVRQKAEDIFASFYRGGRLIL